MPIILALLPSLIGLADGLFPKKADGVSTGPQKKDFVFELLALIFDELDGAGHLPPFFHDNKAMIEKMVSGIIDSIIAAKKANGVA